MREVSEFSRALWVHSRAILSGSGLAVGILVFEHYVWPIPGPRFWIVLLVTFLWAAFRGWQHEYREKQRLEARILAGAPELVVEYDSPGVTKAEEELRVRNLSGVVAYNVQLQRIVSGGYTVEFPLEPTLPPGRGVVVPVRTTSGSRLSHNRLYGVLMGDKGDDLEEWGPFDFELTVRFSDYAGNWFESSTVFNYIPVIRQATVKRVKGRRGVG